MLINIQSFLFNSGLNANAMNLLEDNECEQTKTE